MSALLLTFRCLLICGALGLVASMAPAAASSTQQDGDGLNITPEMLSPAGSSSTSGSNASTLGLEYKFQKSIPLPDSVLYKLPSCLQGCNDVWGLTGGVSGSGKLAANASVNVGDLIDTSGTFGAEYYHFANLPVTGQAPVSVTGDSTLTAKASFEAGQRLSTRHYTYGVSSSNTWEPTGGPPWLAHISWPTLLLEFARVDPTNDAARKTVDPSLSDYNRFHLRVSGGVKIASFEGRELRIDAKYDHWREISPPAAIVAADLNAQTYRAYSVVFVGRGSTPDWLITYASGSVPTDETASKVWQLGWRWNFGGSSQGN